MLFFINALLLMLLFITGSVTAAENQPIPVCSYAADDLDSVRNIAVCMAKEGANKRVISSQAD